MRLLIGIVCGLCIGCGTAGSQPEGDASANPGKTDNGGGEDVAPSRVDAAATGTDRIILDDAAGPVAPDLETSDLLEPAGDLGAPPADLGAPTDDLTSPNGGRLMPCADPTVLADHAQPSTFYVFCTGMKHVWKTSDWQSFSDEKPDLVFDLAGMPARGQATATWWAPAAIYDAAHTRYVMWVSVKDLDDESRSMAVLTSPAPLGPWTFRNFAKRVTATGQNHIDPMLFRSSDGAHYVYWKHYGGGLTSKISGAKLDATLTHVVGAEVAIMNGYNSTGWELNVRENPAVWEDVSTGTWHMLYSGAHWRDGTYATGHAASRCGPLCVDSARGGWHIAPSSNRDVAQVVQAKGHPDFTQGGPGGAVWVGDDGQWIVYAAASESAQGDAARYLQRDRVSWSGGVPYVDNPAHRPSAAPTR